MQKNNLRSKTVGPRVAFLVAELYERQKTIFSNKDVEEITGLGSKSARGLADRLVEHGLATRLKPGLFILVPTELGHERDYLGDPYIVAAEIASGTGYYISHASAMDIHRMVTQPQLVVYATTTQAIRPRFILGIGQACGTLVQKLRDNAPGMCDTTPPIPHDKPMLSAYHVVSREKPNSTPF